MDNNGNGKSRQVLRKEQRNNFKQNDQMRKQGNIPMRRHALTPLLQQMQALLNRVASLELTTAALYKALANKSIVTDDEFSAIVEREQERSVKFKEVQQSSEPYEDRVQICKEWDIPVKMTVIPEQIKDDHALGREDKLALAEKFGIPTELVSETVQTSIPDEKPDS